MSQANQRRLVGLVVVVVVVVVAAVVVVIVATIWDKGKLLVQGGIGKRLCAAHSLRGIFLRIRQTIVRR